MLDSKLTKQRQCYAQLKAVSVITVDNGHRIVDKTANIATKYC